MKSGVYTITNITNGKMYIGYATNLRSRLKEHRTDLFKGAHPNSYLQNSYNEHGGESFLFEVLEECSVDFLASQEHYWATILNVHDEKYGYNLRATHPENKVGRSSYIKKPESIEKMKATRASRTYVVTEETRKQISETLKNKGTSIPIVQLGLDGTFIEEFISLARCEEKTGVKTRSICTVAKGKKKSTHGYIFKYKKDYHPDVDNSIKRDWDLRKVIQFSLDGEFLKTWNSLTEAALNNGGIGRRTPILMCCKNKYKTSSGYRWQYAET